MERLELILETRFRFGLATELSDLKFDSILKIIFEESESDGIRKLVCL